MTTDIGTALDALNKTDTKAALEATETRSKNNETAISSLSDQNGEIQKLRNRAVSRPGENPEDFASDLTGEPNGKTQLTSSSVVTVSDGKKYRQTGEGKVAKITPMKIEAGRKYRVRANINRSANPIDPSGDGVRFALSLQDGSKAALAEGATQILVDYTQASGNEIRAATGEVAPSFIVMRDLGSDAANDAETDVDFFLDPDAEYFVTYIEQFGSAATTLDISVIDNQDYTDNLSISGDVTDAVDAEAVIARKAEQSAHFRVAASAFTSTGSVITITDAGSDDFNVSWTEFQLDTPFGSRVLLAQTSTVLDDGNCFVIDLDTPYGVGYQAVEVAYDESLASEIAFGDKILLLRNEGGEVSGILRDPALDAIIRSRVSDNATDIASIKVITAGVQTLPTLADGVNDYTQVVVDSEGYIIAASVAGGPLERPTRYALAMSDDLLTYTGSYMADATFSSYTLDSDDNLIEWVDVAGTTWTPATYQAYVQTLEYDQDNIDELTEALADIDVTSYTLAGAAPPTEANSQFSFNLIEVDENNKVVGYILTDGSRLSASDMEQRLKNEAAFTGPALYHESDGTYDQIMELSGSSATQVSSGTDNYRWPERVSSVGIRAWTDKESHDGFIRTDTDFSTVIDETPGTVTFIGMIGQSNGAGTGGTPVTLNTSSTYPLNVFSLKNGVRATGGEQDSSTLNEAVSADDLSEWVPAVESTDGSQGFTGMVHMANLLSGGTENYLVATMAVGGQEYDNLKLGTTPYANVVAVTDAFYTRARELGLTPVFDDIIVRHGEQDRAAASGVYQSYAHEWRTQLARDTKSPDLKLWHWILPSGKASGDVDVFSEVPIDQRALIQSDNPQYGKHKIIGPRYHLPFTDSQHHPEAGFQLMAEYEAKAIGAGDDWVPLDVVSATRSGTTVTVVTNADLIPTASTVQLVIDTTMVDAQTDDGFVYYVDDVAVSISSVSVSGTKNIDIELASTPSGTTEILRYALYLADTSNAVVAGPDNSNSAGPGPRGNVRDSDATAYASGSNTPLYNFLIPCEIIVETA